MLKLKKDFSCVLQDKKTGQTLCTFDASASGDAIFSAGFEGGGIASAGQSFTIFTENPYTYKPFQHEVVIEDRKYLITSVIPSMRRKIGAGNGTKPRRVYIISLE